MKHTAADASSNRHSIIRTRSGPRGEKAIASVRLGRLSIVGVPIVVPAGTRISSPIFFEVRSHDRFPGVRRPLCLAVEEVV